MSKLSKWIKKTGKKIEREISGAIPHQHSAERRAAMNAAAEQVEFYRREKERMERQEAETKAEKDIERRRVQEKQIRSLRRSYRAPGFLDEATGSVSDTLG